MWYDGRLYRSLVREGILSSGNNISFIFNTFLLYYGIPVLYGILPADYFHHYAVFVHAIYICLKESISLEDLKKAELMLFSFCEDFSSLYDEHFITLNVHQLLHLRMFMPKSSHTQIFFKLATQKGNDILLPKRQKKIGGHRLCFGENIPRKIPLM